MKKSVIGGIVVLIIVLAGGGLLLANNNSNDKTRTDTSSDMSSMHKTDPSTDGHDGDGAGTPVSSPTATNSVTIKNFAFNNAQITVKKGTAVTWENNDSVAHTVTETDNQKGPDSGNLDPGKSYAFTFDTVGTYKYHCNYHSNMTGTVTVTE